MIEALRFAVCKDVPYGYVISVVGSTEFLGEWAVQKSRRMRWTPGGIWIIQIELHGELEIPPVVEYKYVIKNLHDEHSVEWEQGENRTVKLMTDQPENDLVMVTDEWDNKEAQSTTVSHLTKKDATAFIVLGKALLPTGEPSIILRNRTNCACAHFLKHANHKGDVIIVTGGKVNQNIASEAEVMKALAIEHGVAESKVIVEDRATSTIESVLNCNEILLEVGAKKVVVVSSDFHMDRVKKIFKELLPKRYEVEFLEDHPDLSDAQRLEEDRTEIRLLGLLKRHLNQYTFG